MTKIYQFTKKRSKIQAALCLFILFLVSFTATAINTVTLGLASLDEKQKNGYLDVIAAFEHQYPKIHIRILTLKGETYAEILKNLKENNQKLDVFTWYGGHRLNSLIKENLLEPLPKFIVNNFEKNFSNASNQNVRFENDFYAVPVSHYPWGFFYNKALFKKLNLTAPKTWQEFLHILETIKQQNITPIAIGTKTPWPAAAWFDYLILRNNSFDFYQELMQGKISYKSQQVQQALSYWKTLIDKNYFPLKPALLDGGKLLPLIVREYAGVYLMGSFTAHKINKKFISNIGYFPFPQMTTKQQHHEISPISVLSMMKNSKQKNDAFTFIQFMSGADIQSKLNHALATLSPHITANFSDNELLMLGQLSLQNASHFSQYFDRETPVEMASIAKAAFAKFIEDGNIEKLTKNLEQQRLKVFKPHLIDH